MKPRVHGALCLSRHEVVGIGDAENDQSFLERCECAVAVANAIDSIKQTAAFVTGGANGEGVPELVDELISTDLKRLEGKLHQNLLLLGTYSDGSPMRIPPYGRTILIAGPSGSGKSTLTAGLVERPIEKEFQVCIIDPEGDYGSLHDVVALGNQRSAPSVNEILSILENPKINLSVSLLGIPLGDRPAFFGQLIASLHALRARTGRPHWLVLDEAHHMLPEASGHIGSALPRHVSETIFVTVHASHLVPAILSSIKLVLATGKSPEQTLGEFANATDRCLVWPPATVGDRDTAIA